MRSDGFFKTMFQELVRTFGSRIRIQDPLQRRDVVKSALVGSSVTAISTSFIAVKQTKTLKEKIPAKPTIAAHDGTNLFYQDGIEEEVIDPLKDKSLMHVYC